ncbi:MAG: DNA polymerase III subunit [Actinomycetota bacterium]
MTLFGDVIGHRPIVEMLGADATRPSHAYLFVGPGSVGKATVARRFAAALLCGDDPDCTRRVLGDGHPDLMLVEPDGRTALTVDRARETVARAVLTPVEADRKVFVFEEAGAMNDEAANALLKTLEEPTPTTVFILIAESEDELPPTVASRARTVVFGRVPDGEIAAALERGGVDPSQAERAAAASGGRPGLALMLATRPEVAAFRSSWLSVPRRVTARPGDAFLLADELVAAADPLLQGLAERQASELDRAETEGRETRSLRERHERERKRAAAALHVGGLEILASWYRDAAAAQFGAPVRNRDLPGADLAELSPRDAVAKARRVLDTIDALDLNQRPELAFSALFSDLGTPA